MRLGVDRRPESTMHHPVPGGKTPGPPAAARRRTSRPGMAA